MVNFLAPILRLQFNLFYRYGYTYIPLSNAIQFDGIITDDVKLKVVDIFKVVSPFEYDDEYVIIHFEKHEVNNQTDLHIVIQDVVSIFPLSKQAKTSIESKIDQRIKLEDPIFETHLHEIENNILASEINRAIDSLWHLFKIEDDKEGLIKTIGIENILKGLEYRKNGHKAFKIDGGNFWSLLIAYDRYDYFPNSPLGYFYDAGQVFGFSKNASTFEGSKLHTFLQKTYSENPNIKTSSFIDKLESEQSVEEYISQSKSDKLRLYVIAPLFLMLKEELRKIDDFKNIDIGKYIENLNKYGLDASAALILLGAFFGYKKFYDFYYEQLGLRIFKRPVKQPQSTLKEDTVKTKVEEEELHNEHPQKIENEVQLPDNHVPLDTLKEVTPSVVKVNVEESNQIKLNAYQKIIYDELIEKTECKLSDLSKLISSKIKGKKFNNENIRKIISEIPGSVVEIFRDKNAEKARIKINKT